VNKEWREGMARANRHYIPGLVWHITHRCHKKDFLLKFSKDRREWLARLYEAKSRYGLIVLDYTVTSNHIHLLVYDRGGAEVIQRSIQLVAGRTAQAYNRRKGRKGAFWEDRYHATAVETGDHLIRCIVYIDLNMVRAGVVRHPEEWPHGGYREIQAPKERYRLIDREALMELLGIEEAGDLSLSHRRWVEEALNSSVMMRQGHWSESIAVGTPAFLGEVEARLGARASGRRIVTCQDGHELKENPGDYVAQSGAEKDLPSPETWHYWRASHDI
jgi:putative transposase